MSNIYILFTLICVLTIPNVLSFRTRNLKWVVDDNGCRTPDSGVGNCVLLSQCPTLKHLASSRNGRLQLDQYRCSYKGGLISVCCPNKPIEENRILPVRRNTDLLPDDCGYSQAGHKITGGDQTDLFEFPWQVALQYNNKIDFCGGSLISNRYVLTAAHCINKYFKGVRLGEHNLLTNPDCYVDRNHTICAPKHIDIIVNTQEVTIHKDYSNRKLVNDIALIRLPEPVQYSQSISPICLPKKEALIKEMANLTVIGWGLTEFGKPSQVLLKVTVPTINTNLCKRVYRSFTDVSDRQFCAGGKNNKDSCIGDSGGPIMQTVLDDGELKWVQTGIVSLGSRYCGDERFPALYTKVIGYMDWILDNIKP